MPKYYIRCLDWMTIIQATGPLDACVRAGEKMQIGTVGLSWVASERGFEKHEDDILIPDYYIIEETMRRQKKDNT